MPSDNTTEAIDHLTEAINGIGDTFVFLILILIAVSLTVAMFMSRNSMLGFPCGIFWAILGGYAFTQSATPWGDWQFYLFFSAALGMTVFTIYAAFGLREKHDSIGDESIEKGEGAYVDEDKTELDTGETKPSVRTRQLRERAVRRRTGESRQERTDWGDFK